jgi:hypothetical protein
VLSLPVYQHEHRLQHMAVKPFSLILPRILS